MDLLIQTACRVLSLFIFNPLPNNAFQYATQTNSSLLLLLHSAKIVILLAALAQVLFQRIVYPALEL